MPLVWHRAILLTNTVAQPTIYYISARILERRDVENVGKRLAESRWAKPPRRVGKAGWALCRTASGRRRPHGQGELIAGTYMKSPLPPCQPYGRLRVTRRGRACRPRRARATRSRGPTRSR